jgi:hypothetical protein
MWGSNRWWGLLAVPYSQSLDRAVLRAKDHPYDSASRHRPTALPYRLRGLPVELIPLSATYPIP